MPTPRIVAEYIGTDTEHLSTIPASDLTEEQMDALSEDQRTMLLANAASDHAIYKLHGRDIKAEAKEVVAEMPTPAEEAPAPAPAAPVRTQAPTRTEEKK
jgi:hypothetical protein